MRARIPPCVQPNASKNPIGMECQEPPANGVPACRMRDGGRRCASGSLMSTRMPRQVRAPRGIKRATPGRGMSWSPETEQGRMGRRVPPSSPGAGHGHLALSAPPDVTTPTCAAVGIMRASLGERHSTPSTQPFPPQLWPFCLAFPYPHLSACRSYVGFGAHRPAGIPLAVAVAAPPGPGAPGRKKS